MPEAASLKANNRHPELDSGSVPPQNTAFTTSRFRHLLRFVAFSATPSAGQFLCKAPQRPKIGIGSKKNASYEVTRRARGACNQRLLEWMRVNI